MSKKQPSIKLPLLTGGFNRFETEAADNQIVDGENVIERNGLLVKRPHFHPVGAGPHYDGWRGNMRILQYEWSGGVPTGMGDLSVTQSLTVGYGTFDKTKIGSDPTADSSGGILLLGFYLPVTGFSLQGVNQVASLVAGAGNKEKYLQLYLIDGTDLTLDASYIPVAPFVDSTRQIGDQTSSEYTRCSLSKDGLVMFREPTAIDYWNVVTLNSVSLYWLCLSFVDSVDNLKHQDAGSGSQNGKVWDTSGSLVVSRPGFQGIVHGRCDGLFPVQGQGTKQYIVTSSRRMWYAPSTLDIDSNFYGQERGGQVGSWSGNPKEPTVLENIILDEGSGTLGQQTVPAWTSGAGSATRGTTDDLTKNDESYNWYQDQFTGALIQTIDSTNFSAATAGTIDFTSDSTIHDNYYTGCVIECTAGANNGEKRLIIGDFPRLTAVPPNDPRILVRPNWGATPLSTDTYKIYAPSARVQLVSQDSLSASAESTAKENMNRTNPSFEIDGATASNHSVNLVHSGVDLGEWSADPGDWILNNDPVNWQIVRAPTYDIGPGRWSYTYDPVTQEFLLCNGTYPIQRLGVNNLRTLAANTSITDPRVQQWTGILNDVMYGGEAPGESGTGLVPQSFLRTAPPTGRYLKTFAGRICVAGISSEPRRVVYSAPTNFNDIWPLIYSVNIRDQQNDPITGMATLNDELIVFTPTAIHASGPPTDDGYLRFTQRSAGIGFAAHESVKEVPVGQGSVLIGATADGVYLYSGGQAEPILDDWKRLLENGVNVKALNRSCAAVSLHENWYMLAVPSAGSEVNDKLLVFDWINRTWWVWSVPYGGISFMARDLSPQGSERILFGHEWGVISTLKWGEAIVANWDSYTARAKSKPFDFDSMHASLQGFMVQLEDRGVTASGPNSLRFDGYINRRAIADKTWTVAANDGDQVFTLNNTTMDTLLRYMHRPLVLKKLNWDANTRAHSFQYEFRTASTDQDQIYREIHLLLKPLSQRSNRETT